MGKNGLFDPKPGFSPACCYSGPVQCPGPGSPAIITIITGNDDVTGASYLDISSPAQSYWC